MSFLIGTGRTPTVRSVAKVFSLSFSGIQFLLDAMQEGQVTIDGSRPPGWF